MKMIITRSLLFLSGLSFGLAAARIASEANQDVQWLNEKKTILRHLSLVELDDGVGGKSLTIRVSGVNLQVVNGLGATNGNPLEPASDEPIVGKTNGVGNLIVGYNEVGYSEYAGQDRTGSHNIVCGIGSTYSSYGGVSFGAYGQATGPYATVTGGFNNEARGRYSSVTGGGGPDFGTVGGNLAAGEMSCVTGGTKNTGQGGNSMVGGGSGNVALSLTSVVCGGVANSANGFSTSILGGSNNTAEGDSSTISGGVENLAVGSYASVTGGFQNMAKGERSTVSGGFDRTATGFDTWVAGSLKESE